MFNIILVWYPRYVPYKSHWESDSAADGSFVSWVFWLAIISEQGFGVIQILFLRHRVCKFHPKPIQHIPIFQTGKLSFSTKYLMEFVIKYYLIYADRTPVWAPSLSREKWVHRCRYYQINSAEDWLWVPLGEPQVHTRSSIRHDMFIFRKKIYENTKISKLYLQSTVTKYLFRCACDYNYT